MDEIKLLSNVFDGIIETQVKLSKCSLKPEVNEFEELLSMGELVDRLTIINIKLYKLKDDVMNSKDNQFKAWAAEQDVYLVRERSRLKKCIDYKLSSDVIRIIENGKSIYNPEVKKYGDTNQ